MANSKKTEKKEKRKFSRPTTALKQKKVLKHFTENGGNMRQAILAAGYSQEVADNPHKITDSKTWQEVVAQEMPDDEILAKHKELLNSTRMDHMVFPLGPEGEDDINFSGGKTKQQRSSEDAEEGEEDVSDDAIERTTLTDGEIIEMLAEVNCKVRRIVHGRTARHVYFWAADNMARDKALDKAYKIKGRYEDDGSGKKQQQGNTYNFIFSQPVQDKVKIIDAEIKDMLTKGDE